MSEIISFGSSKDKDIEKGRKENPFKKVLAPFKSLDRFTRTQLIAILLFVIATPAIIGGYLIFNPRAQELTPETEVTGTMEVVIAEDFVKEPTYAYSIKTDTGKRVKLKLSQSNKGKNAGARVKVKGKKVRVPKDSNVLGDSTTTLPNTPTPQPETAAELQAAPLTDPTVAVEVTSTQVIAAAPLQPIVKKIAVILFNFSDDNTVPSMGYSFVKLTAAEAKEEVNRIMFTGSDYYGQVSKDQSVKKFFEQESRGAVQITGDVFGWYTIPSIKSSCSNSWTWAQQAKSAAQVSGVDLSSYTNVMYIWNTPATGCGGVAWAYIGGTESFYNATFRLDTMAHELGHNFGLLHASSLTCTQNGVQAALSSSCSYAEYGDIFSVMGGANKKHDHAAMIGDLGWLNPGEVQTITTGGTYTLTPILGSPAGMPKLLKIARGNGTYFYLDLKSQNAIFDDFTYNEKTGPFGILIRTSPDDAAPGGSIHNSMLVDTTPGSMMIIPNNPPSPGGFGDAPLLPGKSLYDPISKITITTISVTPGVSAQVKIDFAVPPPPTPIPTPTSTPIPTPTSTSCITGTMRCVGTQPQECNRGVWEYNNTGCSRYITPALCVLCVTPSPTPRPTVPPISGNISFVRNIGSVSISKSGNTTASITVPSSGVAGGHKVIVASQVGTFAGAVSCKDSKGNIYTINARSSTNNLILCSASITTPLVSGDKITVTYPGFSGVSTAIANEFTGISTTDGAFQRGSSTSTTTVSTSLLNTTNANDLILGVVSFKYPFTPANGFYATTFNGLSMVYKAVNSIGAFNTLGKVASGSWTAVLAGYR